MDKLVAGSWAELETHYSVPSPLPDLNAVADYTWREIRKVCPSLPDVNVDIAYDDDLVGKQVLGYATRTMFLKDEAWVSSLKFPWYNDTDVMIRINPQVPNGWHYSFDGSCDVGWRYDLNTVVMHELLHGAGITSSITQDSVGYNSGGCYPTLMDTKIQDDFGFVVNGCGMRRSDHYHIDGVQLYAPTKYNPGSSFSHHNMIGHPMYYNLPSQQCLHMGYYETTLLTAIGESCVSLHAGVPGVTGGASCLFLHWGVLLVVAQNLISRSVYR
jgi:hypothetical protein